MKRKPDWNGKPSVPSLLLAFSVQVSRLGIFFLALLLLFGEGGGWGLRQEGIAGGGKQQPEPRALLRGYLLQKAFFRSQWALPLCTPRAPCASVLTDLFCLVLFLCVDTFFPLWSMSHIWTTSPLPSTQYKGSVSISWICVKGRSEDRLELVGKGSGCHSQRFRLAPQAEIGPGALKQGCWELEGLRMQWKLDAARHLWVARERRPGRAGAWKQTVTTTQSGHSFECRNWLKGGKELSMALRSQEWIVSRLAETSHQNRSPEPATEQGVQHRPVWSSAKTLPEFKQYDSVNIFYYINYGKKILSLLEAQKLTWV